MYFLPPIDPTEFVPGYDYTVDLEGVEYGLEFRWNERLESWFLSLKDSDGEYMLRSSRIIPNKVFGSKNSLRRPTGGGLFAWDTEDTGKSVEYEDLGNRIKIVWLTDSEIQEYT